jgi:hypothetical protein
VDTSERTRIFHAAWTPRCVVGGMALALSSALLVPVALSPEHWLDQPGITGARLGLSIASWVGAAWFFRLESKHALEVGPAGFSLQRGSLRCSFTWEEFDSFVNPHGSVVVLRTRGQSVVTLRGWEPGLELVPLIIWHLEQARKTGQPAGHA